jgi:hypothetical protein
MARRAKTPAEVVKAIGYALFGEPRPGAVNDSHWISLLSRALGKSRFVVNRWATGQTVPDAAEWWAIRRLINNRQSDMRSLVLEAGRRAESAAVNEKVSKPPV